MLPQRKKSVEEIEALRESFGIGAGMLAPEGEPPMAAAAPERKHAEPPAWISDIPVNSASEEILPVLPLTTLLVPVDELPPEVAAVPDRPKIVRSLRKSEQGPLAAKSSPTASSKLPVKRRDAKQVDEIRRQESLAQLQLPPHPMTLVAPLALIIVGYLSIIAGMIYAFFYDTTKTQILIPAALVAVALAIAVFVFLKKPLSRHHAAFIGVLVLFVIVFGTLSYFPNLQNGT